MNENDLYVNWNAKNRSRSKKERKKEKKTGRNDDIVNDGIKHENIF